MHVLDYSSSGEGTLFASRRRASEGAVPSRGGVARRGHLGFPSGPVWTHFEHYFFDVFLKWLFDGLGLHLAPQNASKMRPKRVPKTYLIKKWKSSSRCSQSSIQRGVGVLKIVFCSTFFWNTILGWFLEPILVILAHFLGSLFAPTEGLFGTRFLMFSGGFLGRGWNTPPPPKVCF